MNNQEKAFCKLSKLKVGAIFSETGTGKTKVALDLMASKAHKVDYLLWICPFSIKHEIEAEKEKWHPELEFDVVGVESLGQSDRIYLQTMKKMENKKCFIVVDESLKIKNIKAKRSQRVLKLGQMAEYKLILNGTPLSRNVLDLYTQMNFLSPKILDMSYLEYKNNYCEYYVRGRLKGLVKAQYNIEHLVSKIEPYIVDSDLDIEPKKEYHDYRYSLKNYGAYEETKDKYLNLYDEMMDFDFYAMITELQRIYCRDKKEDLEWLIEKIKEPVIVFVRFLESIPDGALRIDGSVKDRKGVIEQFKKNGGVLYTTYGCGSYGLNLQFCHNIIFAEHCFDYAQRIQAEARIYRMGQTEDVRYYNLWCDTGLEQMIQASLDKKEGLLREVKTEIDKKGVKEWVKNL